MSEPLKVLEHETDDPSTEKDEEIMVLIASHQAGLKAFLRSLVPRGGEVDDLFQRVNLVVWRKRKLFQVGDEF